MQNQRKLVKCGKKTCNKSKFVANKDVYFFEVEDKNNIDMFTADLYSHVATIACKGVGCY